MVAFTKKERLGQVASEQTIFAGGRRCIDTFANIFSRFLILDT